MAYELKSPPPRRGRAKEGVNGDELEIRVSMGSVLSQPAQSFWFRMDLLN